MLRTFLLFLLCLLLAFPQGAFSASSGKASAQVDTGLRFWDPAAEKI